MGRASTLNPSAAEIAVEHSTQAEAGLLRFYRCPEMAQLRNTQYVLSGIGTDRLARRGGPPHSTARAPAAGAGGARDDMADHDETAETETQIRQTPN